MKPTSITISTETAEAICRYLETHEQEGDADAGILAAEIRGMIAADVEEPAPEPSLEEVDPVDYELDIPEDNEEWHDYSEYD